jgi:hypothetical protein
MPVVESGPPESGDGGGATTLVLAGASALTGLLIGTSGPIFVVMGPFLAGGPTWGGIVLALAIVVAALSALVGLVAAFLGFRAAGLGATFLVSAVLVVGIVGGAALGSSRHIAGWALRPTPAPTPARSMAPQPVIYEASGELTLALTGVNGFAQPSLEPYADGVFGHWCSSEPNAKVVSSIAALSVGEIDGRPLWAELHMTDPVGWFARMSLAIPRLTLTAVDSRGVVQGLWVGPATVVESGATAGRLTFRDLPADMTYRSGGYPLALSGELAWRCGEWQPS